MITCREEGSVTAVDRPGRVVAAHRAPPAQAGGTRPAPAWAQPAGRPESVVRDPVRAAHRHPVGVPAPGTGLRLRDDLLAAAGRVEPGWGLAEAARAAAGRTA